MLVCCVCRLEMQCDKNAVGAHFGGGGHVYPGDRFKCPSCGHAILKTNSAPTFDPQLIGQDEYLEMKEANANNEAFRRDAHRGG